MKEPTLDNTPLSQLSAYALRAIVSGEPCKEEHGWVVEFGPDEDTEFTKRYAALLLQGGRA